MVEITEEEVEERLKQSDQRIYIFYCFTPLCGTCKVAKQMLEEWNEQHPKVTLFSINLNLNRSIPVKWKITSVPYVAIFVGEVKVNQFYAFHSLENITRQLAPFVKA